MPKPILDMDETLVDIKRQLRKCRNVGGDPEAWVYLENKDRSIEITLVKVGVPEDKRYYCLRLHCSEEEYDNDVFHSTMGVIDSYCTDTVSDDQLIKGIKYMLKVNRRY